MSDESDDDAGIGWAAVAVLTGCGALSALVESLLVPLYVGRVLVPIAVVLALLLNGALPRLARSAVDRTSAAVAPFAGWLLVVIVLSGFPRPEGDVIYPGGGGYVQWVSYGVLLGGTLAGTLSIVFSTQPKSVVSAEPTPVLKK